MTLARELPPVDGTRRNEILDAAAAMFASSGPQASLKEIADACGILPGSLYHHFESKEVIVRALVERYHADVDIAAAAARQSLSKGADPDAVVLDLATAIATGAARHRGALLLTMYELSTGGAASEAPWAAQMADATAAMHALLRAARDDRRIRPEIPLETLAERLCLSMVHIGLGVFQGSAGDAQMPRIICSLLFDGLAVDPPADGALDGSAALATANEVIGGWRHDALDDDRLSALRAAARTEFARRGFETTTIRDIAAAAGMSTASVYRMVSSKDELLRSVMEAFTANASAGWRAVLASAASPAQKLDALTWVNINLLHSFGDEFRIGLAWLTQTPPSAATIGWSYNPRVRELKALVAAGVRSGELRLPAGSRNVVAHCLLELIWMPEHLVRAGTTTALTFARQTLLRGAATR